ncbi:hypothetical protein [Haliea atlantica]|tara:strand:+ start:917 stop:1075 length:159 start_codon:yes stop_codon:yes gene_type:complete
MTDHEQKLQEHIQKLVRAGVFRDEMHAAESIITWLQSLERDFVQQQMQQEDA